jgi:hypothetical protein
MNAPSDRGVVFRRALRLVLRGLLLAWAGFWAWFVIVVSVGELPRPPLWIPVAWLGSLALLVLLCWKRPTLGGLTLVAAGVGASVFFDNPGARALLAAPAIVLGLGCLVQGRSTRWVASAAMLALCLALVACLTPQDPADLPYRTSSILRHEGGSMKRAFLTEETELEGLPCRSWVWWYEDGRIDNLEIAAARTVQGHAFPAGTRLFYDREGRLAHAWLSEDTLIDGRPCRGKWKIDTAFHANGRVRAFFPPDTLEIDGVPCAASLFNPIYLHPDGRLRQCKLASEVMIAGKTYKKGAKVTLDEAGVVQE